MAVRVELDHTKGMFAKIATTLDEEGASIGAVDMVSVTKTKVIRDITFDAKSEEHGAQVVKRLNRLPHVKVHFSSDRIFMMHLGGKIQVGSKFQIQTRNTLSMAYTPGVARVCQAIALDRKKVHTFTCKSNSVAVVTDGSAVLGLGNLGPEAALPVMEGKSMLFQQFAGVDAWPICLNTRDPEKIVATLLAISPGFGGINLEDISAPRCFEIERRLKEKLDIPVLHDDQHGTAVVVLAALINALKVTNRRLDEIKVVVNGLGAAGTACCQLLLAAGIKHLFGCDKNGWVLQHRGYRTGRDRPPLHSLINYDEPQGTLQEAMEGSDVFIGLSVGNILESTDLDRMANDAIVLALANPDPEISPEKALNHCRVYASGRSDYPNQSNNLLAFPGIFRGALDVRATQINQAMLLAAAKALAGVIPNSALHEEYIIPSVFDKHVVPRVSKAVAKAARMTDVARRSLKHGLAMR
jgi:malate dehydrogenase (oxaloacetate-decarboxylating)